MFKRQLYSNMSTLKIWKCIVFLLICMISSSSEIALVKRVEKLERELSKCRCSLKKDGGLVELKQMINDINIKTSKLEPVPYEEIREQMDEQNRRIEALERALMDEKALVRKLINEKTTFFNDQDELGDRWKNILISEVNHRNQIVRQLWIEIMDFFKMNKDIDEKVAKLESIILGQSSSLDYKLSPCEPNWIQYYDKCYYVDTHEAVTWSIANERCRQFYGGILAELVTSDQMLFVMMHLSLAQRGEYWLGASDRNKEGSWVWTWSRKSMEASMWRYDQPNNAQNVQHCLEAFDDLSKWYNDENCSMKNFFVCQKI